MPQPPPASADPTNLLPRLQPQIQQQLHAELKKAGSSLKQRSQVALRTFFTGAILLPIAAAGGDPAAIAQAVGGILGGLATEHFSDWIKKFAGAQKADDPARLEQLMQQAEASAEILAGLQHLIEKVEALSAAQQALGEDFANWLRQNLFTLPTLPADLPGHQAFRDKVKSIYLWSGWRLAERDFAIASQPLDFLFTKPRPGAEPDRLLVHCVDTMQGRADESLLTNNILGTLHLAKSSGQANSGVLVTNFGFTPGVYTNAKTYGWSPCRYDQLVAQLIDFELYRDRLRLEWEKDEDEIAQYYVPVEFEDNGQRHDLFDYITNDWLTQPQNFLSLVGEYGVGKTSFCRKLAFELAGQAQGRIPILIRLHDYQHHVGIEGLVRAVLAKCGAAEASFEAFDHMNRAGLLLILLDGFDEMIAQVPDFDAIKQAFEELAKLAPAPESRVILTSREEYFEDEHEIEKALKPKATLVTPIKQKRERWALLRLANFSPEQMRTFLERRLPLIADSEADKEGNADFYLEKMGEIEDLLDLGKRAVMLDMIAKTLPRLLKENRAREQKGLPKLDIDPAVLYRDYLNGELERQEKKRGRLWPRQNPRTQRLELLRGLAMECWKNDESAFPAEKVKALIENRFSRAEAVEINTKSRDFLTCSFLIRPGDTHYKFSHRSIQEFLVAEELAPKLRDGTAAPLPLSNAVVTFLHYLLLPELRRDDFYRKQVVQALQQEGLPEGIDRRQDGSFVSRLPGGFEVEMVYVPAGPFIYGGQYGGKTPQIVILEKGLWIDKMPVTAAQFFAFVKATNFVTEAEKSGGGWTLVGGDWKQVKQATWRNPFALKNQTEKNLDHPVVQVSWNDAQAFCKWAGKVLPTEQQWEKASRGIDGRRWPWGYTWNRNNCNSASYWAERDLWDYEKDWKPWWENEYPKKFTGRVMTMKVGQFADVNSPYGCCDSAGNVWEWCTDYYDDTKKTRVLRGGAWDYRPDFAACAFRDVSEPDIRSYSIGFRCART
ncbi:SUMF1/EgtB/PvdO family nonheme iron enzyme [candidate division KSB1 bacterium]|nr:SUMF1/EgtB/PvdO family nonheme iron enzyme [bacterium]NUM68942.1 SUMF1/EgtB/PvdO family nonheme iron enzyme [candidate division KSB1 bacterium]